MVGGMRQ